MPTPQIGSGGNDLFLFTRARAAMNNDTDLKAANVVIEVKEGVVTLGGTVASAALKSKAEQLVRGTGAKDVRNQLKISAGR
jgi:osmotically-inducible protein OsmY